MAPRTAPVLTLYLTKNNRANLPFTFEVHFLIPKEFGDVFLATKVTSAALAHSFY